MADADLRGGVRRRIVGTTSLQAMSNHGTFKRMTNAENAEHTRFMQGPIKTLYCPAGGCAERFRDETKYKEHYKEKHGSRTSKKG